MATVGFEHVSKRFGADVVAVDDLTPGRGRRRVPDPRRPVRLRQDHRAAHGRRPRGGHERRDPDRRASRQRPAAHRSRHRHGLPELRALPAHERPRTTSPSRCASRRVKKPRSSSASPRSRGCSSIEELLDRKPRALSGGQRQRVAIGRALVRRPAGVPDRRAALEPRRQAPRPDAGRADQPPPAARHHDDLRHARPDRGDDARRPRRRPRQGRRPAGRHAANGSTGSPRTRSSPASSAARP